MEMTYDGALVMPSGCVMMDEQEMTYVEGGVSLAYSKVKQVGLAIAAIAGATTVVCKAIKSVIEVGALLSGMTTAAFGKLVGKKLASIGAKIASFVPGVVAKVIAVAVAAIGGYYVGYKVGVALVKRASASF